MNNITIEDYRKALEIVRIHKLCESCGKLLPEEDGKILFTLYYGEAKYWCKEHFEKVKDDD